MILSKYLTIESIDPPAMIKQTRKGHEMTATHVHALRYQKKNESETRKVGDGGSRKSRGERMAGEGRYLTLKENGSSF